MIEVTAGFDLESRLNDIDKKIEAMAQKDYEIPRHLKIGISLPASSAFVDCGGPNVGRSWRVRRIVIDALNPTGITEPTQSNGGSVTNPSAAAFIAQITPTIAGYYNIQATVGYGATAGTQGSSNFRLYANGTGNAVLLAPPVVNSAETYNFPNVYSGTGGSAIAIRTVATDSASGAIYNAQVTATLTVPDSAQGVVYLYSDTSLGNTSLLWEANAPIVQRFGMDEVVLFHPEHLIVACQAQIENGLFGQAAIIDMPAYPSIPKVRQLG